jgi:hypothetical protein
MKLSDSVRTRTLCQTALIHVPPVLQEEADHFLRGVWAARVGVEAGGAAAGPGMAGAMDELLLEQHFPTRVGVQRARVGMPAAHAPSAACVLSGIAGVDCATTSSPLHGCMVAS